MKNDPQCFDFQLSTTLGGGVKNGVSIFKLLHSEKTTCTNPRQPLTIYEITIFQLVMFLWGNPEIIAASESCVRIAVRYLFMIIL